MTDEPDYDDLDADQAFRVGLLTQLDRIATALEAIAGAGGLDPSDVQEDASDAPTFECGGCAATVTGREAAESHVVDEHNAPDDGKTWEMLVSEVDA